ncbi:type I restriction enzyme HsdR N-terminal domain-containing protein [Anabaena sp. UHCC 0451]|uniref:type I restriction enzyme HsdR N-terminal domain-containing protein n=1 Tax=Anabaena sp. UHCC 0451 TaxID=2055235 RepID=UPI002B1F9262|nr:type I restriction enzyme HsdR N-terminal domain-containing protein [Anabaena sp. UHCC 0451]MEA5576507.1 type I restriction enzyme HsdR N-terminal domain-containing protein [Anabaena sp. UHCC 0451]
MEIKFSDNIPQYLPDIVFRNRNENIVLLVEIKAEKLENIFKQNAISQLKTYSQNVKKDIPFGMLVDLEEINIFALTEEQNIKNSISLKTNDILSTYDPEFSQKRIFHFHLETLVKSWLRDLAYHWNLDSPPAYNEVAKIGLLSLMEGEEHTYIIRN